ncbi:ExbD/TolR family protein [Pseudochryseolinea flava]|uniref:Biopolymer transporter ExbD n=1 Tax=Pseudochryseolinea flava TaxID=2059302 RepID=A0A364XZK2_9BACT|nr:biopolymer transporter ExbD [Pseudochryseolinea flava]RAV99052.1 biopolymer transporter ExbD [Pseudochryseolinea flava]
MKIRRKNHFQAEVSTSSLNDIMFFLLLFFLIISTVTNPNVIKVLLPQSKATQALNKQPVILTVTESKQYYINKRPVPSANLEQELAKACEGLDEPTVVIHMPYNHEIQELVDIMQVGTSQKIKMVLATKKK